MRTERDVKAALEVARHREDSAEGKLLRAANALKKCRATRKRLATELRKLQDKAREERRQRRLPVEERTIDLDALAGEYGLAGDQAPSEEASNGQV